MGAVPLTAVTLEAIQRQVLKLHNLEEDKDTETKEISTGVWAGGVEGCPSRYYLPRTVNSQPRDVLEPPCGQAFERHSLLAGSL